jgi:glycerol-3-phosphate dehydrogenase
LKSAIVHAVRNEMARTLDDVLSRRTRALLLDARASAEVAAETARVMAKELGRDAAWERREVERFSKLCVVSVGGAALGDAGSEGRPEISPGAQA